MSAARREGERGIALLIVLLTITLLTIVVVEFTQSAEVETHFAISARNGLQAFYLARSGMNVAEALVAYDASLNHNDSAEDLWAKPMPPLPIGDGTVALRVEDEARRLNLNGMLRDGKIVEARRQVFDRLFRALQADPQVLAAICDWLDDDSDPRSDPPGAEQPFYLALTPPVVVRNGPMLTLRELLQIRGMTPSLFARLAQFVTVLPTNDLKVNVNTAPPEVIAALSDGLADRSVVDRLVTTRREAAFNSPTDVGSEVSGWAEALGGPEQGTHPGGADYIATTSDFFRIDAVGQVNDVTRGIVATVKRTGGGLRARITRVTWAPSTADLSLTSQPPSDFLQALPPMGGQT
ncbi:MAG TPA: type II secretion system minor pseudopilin GspK [Candidatus Binatia bacterium]|jgi:general secretion pathway protein K